VHTRDRKLRAKVKTENETDHDEAMLWQVGVPTGVDWDPAPNEIHIRILTSYCA
jgi:hypothetical protein